MNNKKLTRSEINNGLDKGLLMGSLVKAAIANGLEEKDLDKYVSYLCKLSIEQLLELQG